MLKRDVRIAAVIFYCLAVVVLLSIAPWIDWAKYGNAWVANLAGLPALPVLLLVRRKNRFA